MCATRLLSAFQDVGACLGQDTRRLITDGWGQHQIVALDLVADYWYDISLLQRYNTRSEALAAKVAAIFTMTAVRHQQTRQSCCKIVIC